VHPERGRTRWRGLRSLRIDNETEEQRSQHDAGAP
jgi:hypothetical protein